MRRLETVKVCALDVGRLFSLSAIVKRYGLNELRFAHKSFLFINQPTFGMGRSATIVVGDGVVFLELVEVGSVCRNRSLPVELDAFLAVTPEILTDDDYVANMNSALERALALCRKAVATDEDCLELESINQFVAERLATEQRWGGA